ncbi:ty3-gypsy retrotransposon protein [Cucumis melo var. makuwa]|uniref:Ty3-gypsy retrotransposon protein n=1 Tax=Cucumis melo var. makuwa TaxID=1194695 RepID=A0A5D3CBP5_CUCMM|nr:ty3-gypsy retrotransposon protein [Cucumis melo var. makuwa]TYK07786.1 ty3-gypsy retrotransposon protein [Cucumis melo var. makuwa]
MQNLSTSHLSHIIQIYKKINDIKEGCIQILATFAKDQSPAVVLRKSSRSRIKMERKINPLMKVVEERDHEIAALRKKMQTREIAESSQIPVVKAGDNRKNVVQENQP